MATKRNRKVNCNLRFPGFVKVTATQEGRTLLLRETYETEEDAKYARDVCRTELPYSGLLFWYARQD